MENTSTPFPQPLFRPLETERLTLDCISSADRAFLLREFSDGAINQYLFDEEPFTCLEDADKLIDFYTCPEPRAQHRWIIRLKDSGEKIGTCGFHCWDRKARRAELGYDLQKAYWGRGLMTGAVAKILEFARSDMQLARVDAIIYPDNQRSAAFARRLGFVLTPETKTYDFRGKPYIHNIYKLIFANREG